MRRFAHQLSQNMLKNEAPHSRAVGYLMFQATEVALTMASPNRSRAAGYND
jgi:hypothetical protein